MTPDIKERVRRARVRYAATSVGFILATLTLAFINLPR